MSLKFIFCLAIVLNATSRRTMAVNFCSGKPNGLHGNPNDCSAYYSCFNSLGYAFKCPAGLLFNSEFLYCDWPTSAKCAAKKAETTVASTTTAVTTKKPTTKKYTTEKENEVDTSSGGSGSEPPVEAETHCDSSNCVSPNCYCHTTDIPMGYSRGQVPQFVMPSFDDAITIFNIDYYRLIFNDNRTNPDGCPITGTFFVSNNSTDYQLVEELHARDLEIASHSSTHRTPEDWWTKASKDDWLAEIKSQDKNIVSQTSVSSVKGWRSPFLRLGGNNQFQALNDAGYLYDSSISVSSKPTPSWPFTLDTKFNGVCFVPPCPTHSFGGFFEVPLSNYIDKEGYSCGMFDSCYAAPQNASQTFQLFKSNFERHYNTSRAPFPMFGHASFFTGRQYNFEGFLQFIDYVLGLTDVYVVSIEQMLKWMMNPRTLDELRQTTETSCL